MANTVFTNKHWQSQHISKIRGKAGPRYSPELNIDLPISEIFDGIGRTNNFYAAIRSHFGALIREFGRVGVRDTNREIFLIYKKLQQEIEALSDLLSPIKKYDTGLIPWKKISGRAQKAIGLCWDASDKLREEKERLEREKSTIEQQNRGIRSAYDRFEGDLHYLYQTQKELRYFEELAASTKAQLANRPLLLLTGIAGSGKTHLLCDLVKGRFETDPSLPTVMVFGEHFVLGADALKQVTNQIGLDFTREDFLRKLDQAAKARRCRALLIIDALNETRIDSFWQINLKDIIDELKKYPNIGLIVSIRSGFEREVLTKKLEEVFIREDHPGFQFREWEAVNKFFHEFNLPLPEIPLLTPEFQNPLFLLLFCKAFQDRSRSAGSGRSREIFKGHEGATFIFESFVDSVSKKLTRRLGIPNSSRTNVWDHVIERIAEEMVNGNSERVSEAQLSYIIQSAYPGTDNKAFIEELERNLLIVKVPMYSREKKSYDGFEFRFPFQKFSDHLIGRYLFKKYEKEVGKADKNINTAKKFFSRRRKLGKFLYSTWNRGIVEALSIQCPEHLKGTEFVQVAPYLKGKNLVSEAFIESLIWRKPSAFSEDQKNTLDYINTEIIRTKFGHDNLLNAFLSVAPIPNHPFNAHFLHKHLSKYSMAERDRWWSTFLHYQYGQQGAVDRLVEWGWSSQNKDYVSDDSVRLCCVALAWFLTTPNRFLRDKSTKALVCLLTNRFRVMIDILQQFEDTNDPYILERLYAVAYGVALRSRQNKDGLKQLAQWVYEHVFKKRKPPVHILLRDYARGVLHVALDEGLNLKISIDKITPPFTSTWPKRIPSAKTLKRKYYPEDFFKDKTKDRRFLSIWSSVMHDFGTLGDFGNYILNSALHHWSGRKLIGKDVKRKKLLKEFIAKLSPKQSKLFKKATDPFFGIDFSKLELALNTIYTTTPEDDTAGAQEKERRKSAMAKDMEKFELALPLHRRTFFRKEIKPYLDDRGSIQDPLERFNTRLAQRWVFNRVVELGWDPKLHGEFDNTMNYQRGDRSNQKAERIGKKYQWIAFHELLARVSDNFEFKGDSWSDDEKKFEGAWQLNTRDIDPSCLLKDIPNMLPSDLPIFRVHKTREFYNAWSRKLSHSQWLQKAVDLPDPKQIIELVDTDGNQWVTLQGIVEWQEDTPPEQEKYDLETRTLWYITRSYLIEVKDRAKTVNWLRRQSFMGQWMPESNEFYHVYLGEFPWSPAFTTLYAPDDTYEGWTDNASREKRIPAKLLVTDDQYMSSGSSIDCSTNETISVKLPAKYIVEYMGLIQPYVDGRFYDSMGELVVFDPSVFVLGVPKHIYIRKDKLVSFLKSKHYTIIWTILGEKNLIGGGKLGQPQGWMEINGVYTLRDDEMFGSLRSTFLKSA